MSEVEVEISFEDSTSTVEFSESSFKFKKKSSNLDVSSLPYDSNSFDEKSFSSIGSLFLFSSNSSIFTFSISVKVEGNEIEEPASSSVFEISLLIESNLLSLALFWKGALLD